MFISVSPPLSFYPYLFERIYFSRFQGSRLPRDLSSHTSLDFSVCLAFFLLEK